MGRSRLRLIGDGELIHRTDALRIRSHQQSHPRSPWIGGTLVFPGCSAFLHGLGGASSADFAPVAANPALTGHRSLLIDLFGHGYSDGPEEFSYTLEGHALTISQLLDHLSLKGCAVFGHSMGGSVAITLAALRPDLVSRLVIVEGNLDPGGGMVSKGIAEQNGT